MIRNLLYIPILLCLACAGCSSGDNLNNNAVKVDADKIESPDKDSYLVDIANLAETVDKGFEDGWICRRNSRVLKSGYRFVSPKQKARFAIAYNDMLVERNQNLAKSIDSYVPYSERFKFALKWWLNSSDKEKFLDEKAKKKVVWLHESMLDASELYFRIFEKMNLKIINNAVLMAHEKEQDMVFNYMEQEGQPGSFSKQYAKWADKLKALNSDSLK